ncbi:ecotin family protein [Soonwooa sp.]|uniref:ecotin family protein n=1 Tax=Soonwooa sp. TaxID=1938592 RepID=UPI0026262675|nr:ecotin family protein [Soonwooa sp.]
MKSTLTGGMLLGLSLLSSLSFAQITQKVDITPFPKAEKAMKQVVIEVPHSDSDANKKIEIFVGKNMQTDGCNKTWLSGEFSKSELKGWGYDYLTFKTNGATPSTLMACPNATPKNEFVKSQGYFTDYNGRMPIVLYIPDGYEAKFRIYKAENDLYKAQEIMSKSK